MEWYAVSVFEGNEEKIQDRLKAIFKQSIVTLIPKKRIIFRRGGINKLELNYLFPGYILIKTDMDKVKYEIINKTSGVIRLVNTGNDFTKIDDNEMALILRLINKEGIIEISKILKEGPGANITVLEGPLKGMERMIKKIDSHKRRATVELMFQGSPITIDVGVEVIYPLDLSQN